MSDYYYQTDPETRRLIDRLLQKNATIQSNLGVESTKEERKEAKEKWMELARQIKSIDPKFYRERIQAQHQK